MINDKSIKIVFMGSPEFAVPTLEALHQHYEIAGIVTQPDRPAGRGRKLQPPPVKTKALELNLPLIQPERLRNRESTVQIFEWNPDLIIVAAYGQILKPEVLDLPEYGCINVHASLLPRWRGAAPIQAAILNGDNRTGVTIMLMDEGMDTGPVLNQRSVNIYNDDTGGSLYRRLSKLGAELLIDTLPDYINGVINPQIQDDSLATLAPLLKKKDGELDFTKSAAELERQVRAYNPWPGTFMKWDNNFLKIHEVTLGEGLATEKRTELIPGKRTITQGFPSVMTSGGVLLLESVQPASKKIMSGRDYLSGSRDWSVEAAR
ncbi:MAG: methionyl-tRNA formyltransferase [Anaerolineales bacterium]|jgi:methionyl-tRNA formyltransferase